MRIQNIVGPAERVCACGSWLRHWEKFSGQTTTFCAVGSCLNTDIVGAHVKVAGRGDTTYICPLCREHNGTSGVLLIPDTYPLVPANKALTCERPRR